MAAEALPAQVVYLGISQGVLPAQMLAQTRPEARGAVLISACVPANEFGDGWPDALPLQIHMMQSDPVVTDEGDLAAAHQLVETAVSAQLWLYDGDRHLFVDDRLPDYDEALSSLPLERIDSFLESNKTLS